MVFIVENYEKNCYNQNIMNIIMIFIAEYFYLLVVLIALIFFLKQSRVMEKSMVVSGLVIGGVSYVISRIAGYLYYDPRPFVVGHFAPLIAHAADNGFPSDHVLLTGAIAATIWFYHKKLSSGLWVLVVLTGIARVYVGVHHVEDIVGSIVIVLVVAFLYDLAIKKKFIKGNLLPRDGALR
jgi:undecaprenyl-diphosphatase